MKMVDWVKRLDTFLEFNEYDILNNLWKITAKTAKTLVEKEFKEFQVIQDKIYESDFDKILEKVNKSTLPKE
jgi:hypothetical protein